MYSMQRAFGGAVLGGVIGIIATIAGESPGWWLAVPVGAIGGAFSSGDGSGESGSGSPTWSGGSDTSDSSGGGDSGGGGGGDGG